MSNILKAWDENTSSWVEAGVYERSAPKLKEISVTTPGISYTVTKTGSGSGDYYLPANCKTIHVLMIGGGGGGAVSGGATRIAGTGCCAVRVGNYAFGGGGGAGQVVEKIIDVSNVNSFVVTVGAGGAGQVTFGPVPGDNSVGGDTVISGTNLGTITAIGGGRGGSGSASTGGGTAAWDAGGGCAGGISIAVPYTCGIGYYSAGGGGGIAGSNYSSPSNIQAAATAYISNPKGTLGDGLGHSTYLYTTAQASLAAGPQGGPGLVIFGRALGGGGVGASTDYPNAIGGGSYGAALSTDASLDGQPNTGAGGGAAGTSASAPNGGNGGSGLCVIRYYE